MESKLLLLLASNFGSMDRSLQREVYHEFYHLVYGSILYILNDHAAAEDIIQESFLKALKNLPMIENEMKLRNWIKVVARNNTYNYLRKNKKNRNEINVESVFINESNVTTQAETLETEVEVKIMVESLVKLLHELKPEFRALMEMRWKQNLSYKDMADHLGIAEALVKSKLHRAREAVKKRFLKEWGESK
jgi:RNA polymerase sigma-70 factor (ECF subfamily)